MLISACLFLKSTIHHRCIESNNLIKNTTLKKINLNEYLHNRLTNVIKSSVCSFRKLHKHSAINSDAEFTKNKRLLSPFLETFMYLPICFPSTFVRMSFTFYVYQSLCLQRYCKIPTSPYSWYHTNYNVMYYTHYTRIVQFIQVITFKWFVITGMNA